MENEIVYDDISDFCNCSKASKFRFSSEIPNREHFLAYVFFLEKLLFKFFFHFSIVSTRNDYFCNGTENIFEVLLLPKHAKQY